MASFSTTSSRMALGESEVEVESVETLGIVNTSKVKTKNSCNMNGIYSHARQRMSFHPYLIMMDAVSRH